MKSLPIIALLIFTLFFSSSCSESTTTPTGSPATGDSPIASNTTTPVAEPPGSSSPTTQPGGSTPLPVSTTTPDPSPTGTSPAHNRILLSRDEDVWSIDPDNRQATRLIEDGHHFSWSPDGQEIVFVRGHGDQAEIWLARSDGSGQRRVTHNEHEDIWPQWSPNGQTICFTSSSVPLNETVPWQWRKPWEEAGSSQGLGQWAKAVEVWLADRDGSNPRRLTAGFGATWAPDSRRLAFHRRTGEYQASILLINSEGKNEWKLATSAASEGPVSGGLFYGQSAWSPNGQDIVYNVASYAMLSDWGILRRAPTLSQEPLTIVGQTGGYSARTAYSPDSQLLVSDYYGSDGRGSTDGLAVFWLGQGDEGNFYGEPIQTIATKVLSVPGAHSPAWSPNGRLLAYTAGDSIWLWDRSTQEVVRLIDNVDTNAGLSWSGN